LRRDMIIMGRTEAWVWRDVGWWWLLLTSVYMGHACVQASVAVVYKDWGYNFIYGESRADEH